MKKIFFITFMIALMAISENAICQTIILKTNCRDWNEDLQCLQPDVDGNTQILIRVDFASIPQHKWTNWKVRFHASPPAADKIFYRADFGYDYSNNTFIVYHQFPIGTQYGSSAFTTTLWSADNTEILDRHHPGPQVDGGFVICTGNNKLSLNQSNFDAYNIYPNPVEQEITVEYQAIENELVTFEILDIEGRSIYTKQFEHPHDGLYSKHIENLELVKGLYFCRIQTANSQKTIKVTKL